MKDIPGYEGLYAATSCGKIWSYRTKKFLSTQGLTNGYPTVSLCKDGGRKTWRVHKLIARTYLENPEGKPEVNHKDGNRTNNCINNLEWVTCKENLAQADFAGKPKCFSKVRCIETGIIYNSCAAAARDIGIHRYGINLVLLGKQRSAGGYHWERVYKNEEKNGQNNQ